MLPASAVPVRVGRATLVTPSPRMPLSLAGASARMAGTAGAVVSRVTTSGPDGTDVLLAASVLVAVRVFGPSLSGTVAAMDQAPVAGSAVPVPIRVAPS